MGNWTSSGVRLLVLCSASRECVKATFPMVLIAPLQLQSAPGVCETKPADGLAPTAHVHPD